MLQLVYTYAEITSTEHYNDSLKKKYNQKEMAPNKVTLFVLVSAKK